MIVVDTREKKWSHVEMFFRRNNVTYELKKIETGDYYNSDFPRFRVDRKQNLDEVATNVLSSDQSRFWRELERSRQEKLRFYILVEHSRYIKRLEDVCNWNPYWSKRITGRELAQKMWEIERAYNVRFVFCQKNETGQKILELLRYKGGSYDERGNQSKH